MTMWKLIGAMAVSAAIVSPAVADVTVSDPTIRAPLGGRNVTAAYMTLVSDTDDQLIAARSPLAKSIELHTHEADGDIMRMRQVDVIDLPAGEPVVFAPRGLHLMVFGAPVSLVEGDTFPIELEFASGETLAIEAHVKNTVPPATTMSGHNH